MTNKMGLPTILPAELWLAILSHLYLPDLVSVSATSSVFQALAAESLAEHRALRHRFHRIGHDHHHEHDYWYLHLLTLLREPVAAYYVEVLTAEHTNTRLDTEPWTVLPVSPVDEALIREAVEKEDWIADTEKEKYLNQLLAGDEDAMVTLMILRMPNLKRLTLPSHCWGGLDIQHLMPIVARIAETASNADPDRGPIFPLSELEHYEGHVFNGSYGVDFESIAPLMALPSLRTMCTPYNSEGGFNWPASLPKSRVRRIDIPNGEITREVIVDLARNIRGPCVIRQVATGYNDTPEDVDWSVLEIPFEGACEAEWTIEGDVDTEDSDNE
ncbi:hypothetical protein MVEN_02501300 [Mycena venus]|uniref:Leucine-rich repeat domain-containing protein n=1 Tax=Mycena venus TaxID=2733690 RepID=A0A8H6WST5_9AGAR|nr:hypothetical protein MVEN_02501300 [Mycena venus]